MNARHSHEVEKKKQTIKRQCHLHRRTYATNEEQRARKRKIYIDTVIDTIDDIILELNFMPLN